MTIGSIGKALANQAMESTKNTVIDAVRTPDTSKATPPATSTAAHDTGGAIIGQIQAMQRPLKDDQELALFIRAAGLDNTETLRVTEIFVPNPEVLVFAGTDKEGHVTRVIAPVQTAQVVCKLLKVQPGAAASRVNILTPRPQPKPAG
ncbi:MAG: hypothetical protein M3N93_01960 [Acidobacteriota bacterium]|nr:hypothetical protein [Acidobacteriota bacterium]